ncbi:DUF1796 family putative cysteine peptidase [Lysinibacillus odysseyi]|uniref:Peptidase n=1 Tax=Lysinibacillus odysseyi 34hs-1 = NBRC 100172 TaxID=1220589 RepID=A0A0A3IKU7_9BACI|nr:DUF1796 family putative cysteine peptidase [Lysinibacillus odysseyi]KGR85381.1 peptidase [Lysinibacillus odysseyi 34hs-1 = NBRC 100172]
MKREELLGGYDAIFSLGDLCLTSIQLKKHGLRPYSGVFDWAATPILSKVNMMLRNRFAQFMEVSHLRAIGPASDTMLCVADDYYDFVSNHDFELSKNTMTYLGSYYEVMDKYNRRINRFLYAMNTARRILFVRTEGDFGDVMELQATLRGMVKNDFNILVINHEAVDGIVEKNWPLPNVYAVAFPNSVDKWEGNNALWSEILQGIYLEN